MEVKFTVTKEERKALVAAISELTGCASAYQGAPSFAFAVGNYIIDRNGTLVYDERVETAELRTLLTELEERGFMYEGDIDEIAPTEVEPELPASDGQTLEEQSGNTLNESNEVSTGRAYHDEDSGVLVIEVPLAGFTQTAHENLEKLVTGKADLIMKAIGVTESPADDLPIHQTESTLRFPWFPLPLSNEAIDAYAKFVCALCDMAKKQKRVTLKDKEPDPDSNDKFAFRCFLLRLGFMGDEYKSARRVLLSKLSGSGSFKSGNHKRGASTEGATTVDSGAERTKAITVRESGNDADNAPTSGVEAASPPKCQECLHHCYFTVGTLCTSAGDVVDTSNRTPESYTHYCLGAPSGFRKIKHATDWSGCETAPKWCPLSVETKDQGVKESHIAADSGEDNAEAISVREGEDDADSAAAGGNKGAFHDCLACANSLSEPAENDGDPDRLFCVVKQEYVEEDGSCGEFNS